MRIGCAQKSRLQRLSDRHRQTPLHRVTCIIYHDKGVVIAYAGGWDEPKAVAKQLQGLLQPTFRTDDWCIFRIFDETLEIWAFLLTSRFCADGSQR
jgi:hypothetical protein